MLPAAFLQGTSGSALAAVRRGDQCGTSGGACPELVERVIRVPRSPTFDLQPSTFAERGCSRGFTLLELLVVMGIIVIALAALVPAVTSLSKSGGRRAACNSLLGGIEQARAEAIKSSQATYVVFPAGVALRSTALSNLADPATLTPPVAFSFAPDASAAPLKCFKFNSNGEVQAPAGNVLLGIFEGYVNSDGSEVATTKDGSGNASAVEYLMVSQFTGRAEPTASP